VTGAAVGTVAAAGITAADPAALVPATPVPVAAVPIPAVGVIIFFTSFLAPCLNTLKAGPRTEPRTEPPDVEVWGVLAVAVLVKKKIAAAPSAAMIPILTTGFILSFL